MGFYPLYSTWFSIFCNLISKIICFFFLITLLTKAEKSL